MAATTSKDYYELLGVSREASQDDIRKAYRKLAQKLHPDKTGGDPEAEQRLKEINAAYDTLKNPEKRKAYDEILNAGPAFGMGGGRAQGSEGFDFDPSQFGGFGGGESFEDLFGSIFGGAGRTRGRTRPHGPRPGADLETTVRVTLRDVLKGTTRTVRVPRHEECGDCHGSGAAAGSTPQTCSACNGTGMYSRNQGSVFMQQTCPQCGGQGQTVTRPCGQCRGTGTVQRMRDLSVTIPASVESGTRLRLKGEGEAGAGGGPRGDLYVRVEVAPDARFTRDGANVECDVDVPFTKAALGGKVNVPTLEGEAQLTIPEGAQTGTRLRMRGLGLPAKHGKGRGDQFVKVRVTVPKKLTAKQKELLREFEKLATHG